MSHYTATFFTHYDAVMFAQLLMQNGVLAKCCPVPRELSSSCGTAVRFSTDTDISQWYLPQIEQICELQCDKWSVIFDNK